MPLLYLYLLPGDKLRPITKNVSNSNLTTKNTDRAYAVQAAKQTLYKQYKSTNHENILCSNLFKFRQSKIADLRLPVAGAARITVGHLHCNKCVVINDPFLPDSET